MAGSRLAARVRAADPTMVAALAAGLGAVAVIRTTMLPTVGTWDTAEAQVVLPLLGTMHPTGFPAFVVLGWLASIVLQPLGTPAFLMNLMAVLLVGFAVGGSVFVTRRLGAPLPVAVAVAVGFSLTPVVWGIGNAADAHALHLALVVAVVLGLLRWEALVARLRTDPDDPRLRRSADRAIVLTAAVFGVAVANHALALLLVPVIGLYVLAVDPRALVRPRLVFAAVGACLGVAALLYLELPLRAGLLRAPLVYGHPETWNGFWDTVLARQFQGDVGSPFASLPAKGQALVDMAFLQFGPLVAVIPASLVLTVVRHPRYALLSIAATAITCFFAASYANARIDRYYLGPVFFAWTWIAVFAAEIVERVFAQGEPESQPEPAATGTTGAEPGTTGAETRTNQALRPELDPGPDPIFVPAWRHPRTVLAFAVCVALLVPTATALSTRWHDLDRSRETWVDSWLDEAFTAFEPNAVVISWWSYATPLWYGQLVEGRRPDVWIVDDRMMLDMGTEIGQVIEANLGKRPVYVIRVKESEVQGLTDRYTIEPVGRPGNLYRVTGRQETSP